MISITHDKPSGGGHNQPPVRVTDEQFAKISAKQRIDCARQFPQPLESGVRCS